MKSKSLSVETFLASVFGVGFIPYAPGTYGSIVAAAIYLLLPQMLFSGKGWLWYTGFLVILIALAVWLSSKAEKKLGPDAPQIVIDEVCGFFLSVLLLPKSFLMAVYALVIFRALDIAKPFPIKISQKLPRGWGIVIDDLIAGVYTNILIHFIKLIAPKFFG
ncbi:MAG TPA: phosphatidylglycerophosphatase A [Candidatus Syntrophosphaera thermopropionivorans]|jgi:phosphatidylglycerophosphatase A|uniref:Phosphatidylglycerophosphatase A n=1 Tax=Candidatus Syntrophosphaera thermopropionivorans TaxID=2593015 RepID=A0AC61QMV3_9BACT|nr:phosphatidylglycerophosphatase A [Candidatus Syntrophosphaera thermopropionivorans]TDF74554.1 phosphatidylglycerophosphatase A [Candidatus Syntrophosphaera thermopropionivorans]HPW24475.1 phosphatidylglycerophosphatase A [Candidatus Syntrophosphaera thermopropionivorans]HQC58277.1 phosphatidylglycerophosphatase A [Candidatus Syntrophosphaera thermopropionivorans]HQF81337.1 phosphatidylglycerophosphatase A [Candidatus Syntrophosphaera thermopropionivorans]HQK56938.1 phosphatidylglycerophosph